MPGRTRMWIVLASVLLVPALALTQDAQRGGRRNMEQFRERMMNNIKEQLSPSETEWKTLEPKIEKVVDLQRELRVSYMGRMGRRGAEGEPQSKVAEAQQELRTAVENQGATEKDITQKLAAYREARDKAQEQLKAAQKELKQGLTPRQEAVLVLNGLIE